MQLSNHYCVRYYRSNGLSKQSFAKSANLTGAIITKLDGSSRGGVF